jgi:hypothetical protein
MRDKGKKYLNIYLLVARGASGKKEREENKKWRARFVDFAPTLAF